MLPLFPPNDELRAFLRACQETPEDDAPRLIFADFLEENGHPERAQYIRVQCAMARQGGHMAATVEFRDYEDTLLRLFAHEWLLPWRDGLRYGQRRFSRGLVDLEISARAFVSAAHKQTHLAHDFAWVEQLTIYDIDRPHLKPIAHYLSQTEELRTLRLDIGHYDAAYIDETLGSLWRSPAMKALRHLTVGPDGRHYRSGAITWYSLISSPQLRQLQTLHLRNANIDLYMAKRLAAPEQWPALVTLDLRDGLLHAGVREELSQRFFAQGLNNRFSKRVG